MSNHLKSGQTISCGCARKGANAIDITDQRFGRLIAIKPTAKRLGNSIIWECKCDCKNICKVAAINLRKGHTQSCGCLFAETHSITISTAKNERDQYYVGNTDVMRLINDTTPAHNTSGYTGISYDKSVGLWKATITFRGKKYYLGSAHSPEDLVAIRKTAKEKLHRDFLNWYAGEYPEAYKKLISRQSND